MKLEITMTQRDKKLLIFLSIFVIVVCVGYWGIFPLVKDIMDINVEVQDQRDIQMQNELKVAQLMMLEDENKQMQEEIQSAREQYYDMLTSDEIDRYFTDMVLGYNLYSYDMDILMPTDTTQLTPYQYSQKSLNPVKENVEEETSSLEDEKAADAKEDEKADAEKDENADEEEEIEEPEVSNGIYTVTVKMRLGGELKNIERLIKDLSNTEQKIRVCKYAYNTVKNVTPSNDGNMIVSNDQMLDVTVEIYMCEKEVENADNK